MRNEATIATYDRAIRDKNVRDDLIVLHRLEEGQWVLVCHERPQKFEAKWFGPYEIIQKKLLGDEIIREPKNLFSLSKEIYGLFMLSAIQDE